MSLIKISVSCSFVLILTSPHPDTTCHISNSGKLFSIQHKKYWLQLRNFYVIFITYKSNSTIDPVISQQPTGKKYSSVGTVLTFHFGPGFGTEASVPAAPQYQLWFLLLDTRVSVQNFQGIICISVQIRWNLTALVSEPELTKT